MAADFGDDLGERTLRLIKELIPFLKTFSQESIKKILELLDNNYSGNRTVEKALNKDFKSSLKNIKDVDPVGKLKFKTYEDLECFNSMMKTCQVDVEVDLKNKCIAYNINDTPRISEVLRNINDSRVAFNPLEHFDLENDLSKKEVKRIAKDLKKSLNESNKAIKDQVKNLKKDHKEDLKKVRSLNAKQVSEIHNREQARPVIEKAEKLINKAR